MQVQEIITQLKLKVITGEGNLETQITGGYVSDLLSNVMGQAESGSIWVTMQGHQNIVAVAALAGLSAVIVAGDAELENEAINKATKENIVLLTTAMSSFEVTGRLYNLGIAGKT